MYNCIIYLLIILIVYIVLVKVMICLKYGVVVLGYSWIQDK